MVGERASKKQRELLSYIDAFIKGNNYGPSYREMMRALGYKSVSTVATHVDGLIAKGYLRKTDNSARSIEVVTTSQTSQPLNQHQIWLKKSIGALLNDDTPASTRRSLLLTLRLLDIDTEDMEPTRIA